MQRLLALFPDQVWTALPRLGFFSPPSPSYPSPYDSYNREQSSPVFCVHVVTSICLPRRASSCLTSCALLTERSTPSWYMDPPPAPDADGQDAPTTAASASLATSGIATAAAPPTKRRRTAPVLSDCCRTCRLRKVETSHPLSSLYFVFLGPFALTSRQHVTRGHYHAIMHLPTPPNAMIYDGFLCLIPRQVLTSLA